MLEEYYNAKTKTLTLPFSFNEELTDLPLETMMIIFEEDLNKLLTSKFNKSVDNLPNNLTYLTFGAGFNQPVDNLPSNLTHLILGGCFDQLINNLPENLTHLTFGFNFNQSMDNLPLNIKKINMFNHQKHLLKKVPFDCKVFDKNNGEIFV